MQNHWMFIKEFLRSPKNIGAVCASSKYLTKTVCDMLPDTSHGTVVEIGPGTGAITCGLIKHITKPEQLILIERSQHFAHMLQKSYPNISVFNGDALELQTFIPTERPVAVIVSSMPLLTIDPTYRKKILSQFYKTLVPSGKLVFISYNFCCNKTLLDAGFVSLSHKFIVKNIPPARVDCFVPVQ